MFWFIEQVDKTTNQRIAVWGTFYLTKRCCMRQVRWGEANLRETKLVPTRGWRYP